MILVKKPHSLIQDQVIPAGPKIFLAIRNIYKRNIGINGALPWNTISSFKDKINNQLIN